MKKFSEFTKVNEEKSIGDVNALPKFGTKILFVKGTDINPDYAASEFESTYHGTKVSDIMENPDAYLDPKDSQGEWVLEVMKFGNIDDKFIDFLFSSDLIDYETTKDKMFYFSDQVIGQ